jgi:hypothetical protein
MNRLEDYFKLLKSLRWLRTTKMIVGAVNGLEYHVLAESPEGVIHRRSYLLNPADASTEDDVWDYMYMALSKQIGTLDTRRLDWKNFYERVK